MLSSIALEDTSEENVKSDSIQNTNLSIKEASYEITEDNGDTMTLSFSLPQNTEAYLFFDNLYFQKESPSSKVSKISVNCQGVTNHFSILSAGHKHYTEKTQYLCNLGYSGTERTTLTIHFNQRNQFSYDDIKILYYDYNSYLSAVSVLKEDTLQNVNFTGNTLTGTIDLNEDKILCLSIPYAKGWSAYVDGEKTDIQKGNYMFSCIFLPSGSHSIELRYHTPYLALGALITLASIAGVILILLKQKKKNPH